MLIRGKKNLSTTSQRSLAQDTGSFALARGHNRNCSHSPPSGHRASAEDACKPPGQIGLADDTLERRARQAMAGNLLA